MVLPLVDEFKPKCYLCNECFESIEKLRDHLDKTHKEFVNFHETRHEPAPGDVSIF
ncbi:MAG TPA: hypothetical protein VFM64_04270 [Candidatus Nitrosotenuis sp.]|nr:hypothetical protein [Candidatus Nitrosotenuis sp.]